MVVVASITITGGGVVEVGNTGGLVVSVTIAGGDTGFIVDIVLEAPIGVGVLLCDLNRFVI
jgi:hypothetical protein